MSRLCGCPLRGRAIHPPGAFPTGKAPGLCLPNAHSDHLHARGTLLGRCLASFPGRQVPRACRNIAAGVQSPLVCVQ